jgi:hypothetical protein
MTEKQWRVRFFGGTIKSTDHYGEMAGELWTLPDAVEHAVTMTFDSDTRKPFVYYDDHARGHIGEQRGCQAGCW